MLKQVALLLTLAFLSTWLPTSANGELASKEELYEGKEYAAAFHNPEDDPELPNILLIGDSISNAYTVDVRKLLHGKADVFRIPGNGKDSDYGLRNLNKWLSMKPGKWDLIHFNWGLWDLCYRNPKSKTQGYRDKVDGKITATPEQYQTNMEKIVARLKQTEATLIWCSTTPVPEHEAGRKLGDDLVYNEIAAEIMMKNGVLINDLHAHALLKHSKIQTKKGDVHYTKEGSAYLAEKVAQEIAAALPVKSSHATVTIARTALSGIGKEQGVMRRDPSDVIKVGDLYYVWYSKGKVKSGYDATVWYATSKDGLGWTEQGQALAKGQTNEWDSASVFTPNILVAEERYWLIYTGTSNPMTKGFIPDSKIGIAVSDSPNGPWKRLPNNPAVKNSENKEDFDSMLIDDSCLMVRNGQYWLYYKGRAQNRPPSATQMGLAIAEKPEGPYVKHEANPVIPGNHAILAWPQGKGVAAMIGTTGPKEIINSVLYAEDGVHFTKTHQVVDGPRAAGSYRPEAFTGSNSGKPIEWCIEIGKHKGKDLPYLERCEVNWSGK